MRRRLYSRACKLCRVPFVGVPGWFFHAFFGIEPFQKNPNICNS